MNTAEIKAILSQRINPDLLEEAKAEGMTEEEIFTPRLLTAMTFYADLEIDKPWQLSALSSGLRNYPVPIDWNQTDNLGNTPLHYVVWSGSLEGLDKALKKIPEKEHEEQLTKVNQVKMGVIHFASLSGNADMLERVLTIEEKTKKSVLRHLLYREDKMHNYTLDKASFYMLDYAVLSGNPQMLESALTKFAYPPKTIEKALIQSRALLTAARSGNPAMFNLVLEKAPEALKKADKHTLLYAAIKSENPDMLALLESKPGFAGLATSKAFISFCNKELTTLASDLARVTNSSVWSALKAGDLKQLIAQFETLNLNPEAIRETLSSNGFGYLYGAGLSGKPAMVEFILEQLQYSPEKLEQLLISRDRDGFGPLDAAAISGNPAMLELMLTKLSPEVVKIALETRRSLFFSRSVLDFGVMTWKPAMLEWILLNHQDWAKEQKFDLVLMAAKSGNADLLNTQFKEAKQDFFWSALKSHAWAILPVPQRIFQSFQNFNQARIAYNTLLEALKTNFVVKEAPSHVLWWDDEWLIVAEKKIPPEIMSQITPLLERNRLLMAPLEELIKTSDLFGSKAEKAAKKAVVEEARALKLSAYSLKTPEEQAQFFEAHRQLTKPIWAKRLKIDPEQLDKPLAILTKFQERAPNKTNFYSNTKEKNLFGMALKEFAETDADWSALKNHLETEISAKKIKPSSELKTLLHYLDYRIVVGGKALAYAPELTSDNDVAADEEEDPLHPL